MKFQQLLIDLRRELSELVTEIEASSAMGHFDAHRIAEDVIAGVLREILGFRALRNLNATERANFPGIDLADDDAHVAVQVTATTSVDKIVETLRLVTSHGLHKRYSRLIIYVLTRRQSKYHSKALQTICDGKIDFSLDRDVIDFRNISTTATHLDPNLVQAALDHLVLYKRGGTARGLAAEDLNPPSSPEEKVTLNVINTFIPKTIYVADLLPEVTNSGHRGRPKQDRKAVRDFLRPLGLLAPSDYEVRSGQLITFYPLEEAGPFERVVDRGTVTPMPPKDYFGQDADQERTFKSLLRFAIQQKLYRRRVRWFHEDGLFAFLPLNDDDLLREESWSGARENVRTVYERKLSKKDENKTFICKHFAFAVDFLLDDDRWLAAIAPDWYFSYGEDYRRSLYADESLAWLKRHENNKAVFDHFRFIHSWLLSLDTEDLLTERSSAAPTISFGDGVEFSNHPKVDDDRWLPLREPESEDDRFQTARLFDWK